MSTLCLIKNNLLFEILRAISVAPFVHLILPTVKCKNNFSSMLWCRRVKLILDASGLDKRASEMLVKYSDSSPAVPCYQEKCRAQRRMSEEPFPAPSRRRACVVTAQEISSSACWHSAPLTLQGCGRAGFPVLGKGLVPEHALLLEKVTPGLMPIVEAQNEVIKLFLCHLWPSPEPIDTWNTFKGEVIRAIVLSYYIPLLKFP